MEANPNISISGNSINLDYTGKSGVSHEKCFTDERIAKALKQAIKKSPSRYVFETSDGFRIKADRVNRYLKDFSISAKDIRGFLANQFTLEKCSALGKKIAESFVH
jgi:DNA topoisomerase IB